MWAWEPTLTQVAKDFTKKTGIKVDLKNVGTNTKEYTQLDNAIEAGPVLRTSLRLSTTPSRSTPSRATCWTSPTRPPATPTSTPLARGLPCSSPARSHGLPMDSGPMAFFYNKEVFDKAGVDAEQIKTWDQYYDAAKKIHALGDNYYITSDTGDAGFFDSMTCWPVQSRSRPLPMVPKSPST